ncbi:hypothetical protein BDN70DRAFT_879886 [Pholiota conissans]|uniref:Glycosyltransferase family 31 protein n=1 Tax=Pholiota conissans TaxID=109636 RepID=A0A9P6CZN4_9AGAR|nr:hypothetical protein BDN70DRAFT_879886 [Pholiota conissans]
MSGYESTDSDDTARHFPLPSRSTSPLPQLYSSSDSDTEPPSLLRQHSHWRQNRRTWHPRPRRPWRPTSAPRRWLRRLVRHPFFPGQPITIILTLILFSVFAISLTLLLIYVLNPDKEPLPWRAYCSVPSLAPPFNHQPPPNTPHVYPNISAGHQLPPFPHTHLETLPPAGVLVGVFSVDSAFERRMLVRTTWASHPRSRDGAGAGDDGAGTSRTIVRFVLGQPLKDWERRVKLEMEMYNDIIILPMDENMNGGKSHKFFSWAALNAWVPPIYRSSTVPPSSFSYSNSTSTPPPLAPHDPFLAWQDINSGDAKPWVRPDFVVKVDDDSFVMLAELEARLRLALHSDPRNKTPINAQRPDAPSAPASSMAIQSSTIAKRQLSSEGDPLIYWGYLVTNRLHMFMAGELYALSWSLVDWVAKDPTVATLTRGAEDKQTAKWMRAHPRAFDVRWTSERCWIYDHPRSGTVYSHGFLFPSEVSRVKRKMQIELERMAQIISGPTAATAIISGSTPESWSHSSVSTFGVRYTPPVPDLSPAHSIEALVEGSDMSLLREGSPMTSSYAWTHREGRRARYDGHRVGGTVVVHFIKKNMWYLETALALLEGEEQSEAERYEAGRTNELPPMHPQVYQRRRRVGDLHGIH